MSEKKTTTPETFEDPITSAQMQRLEADAFASGRVTAVDAMEQAGRAVARVVQALPVLATKSDGDHARPRSVLVLCGPGNNGGDGYVVARLLHDLGWRVQVCAVGTPGATSPHAAMNRKLWQARGAVRSVLDGRSETSPPDVLVDALFGIGLSRGIGGTLGQALNEMDERYPLDVVPRVAVDLPSGLDADSGKVLGAVLAATVSVTFHRRKPVHLIRPDLCGRVERVDIGL